MKWLLGGALFVCVPALAQQKPPAHPEGTNVIAVLLPDSGTVAFNRLAQMLVRRGYRIKVFDQTALRLNTEPRRLYEGAIFSASIELIQMGHTALFSGIGYRDAPGYHSAPLTYSVYSQVTFGDFDFIALGWKELEAIVKVLPEKKRWCIFSIRRRIARSSRFSELHSESFRAGGLQSRLSYPRRRGGAPPLVLLGVQIRKRAVRERGLRSPRYFAS